jgi:hypothetical protein
MYYVLLFLIIKSRLWIICWVLDIRGFGFGSEFSPKLTFGLDLGSRFRLWVWVPLHYIRSESDPLPSIPISDYSKAPMIIYPLHGSFFRLR